LVGTNKRKPFKIEPGETTPDSEKYETQYFEQLEKLILPNQWLNKKLENVGGSSMQTVTQQPET